MDYDEMEKAADEIKSIIKFIHGIEPNEYALQVTAALGYEPIISLNYSPGMEVNIPISKIFDQRALVISDLARLKFKAVWRKQITAQSVFMNSFSTAIEFTCDNQEHSYIWGSHNLSFPLPRIGESVFFAFGSQQWDLVVSDVLYYHAYDTMMIYIKCKVKDA